MTRPPQPVTGHPAAAAPLSPDAGGKVVIIGAGIAGLACGCYLRMNGIPTEIIEAADQPGGLCTAWQRGPYIFDGCLRWLIGAQAPSAFYQIWTELGALAGRQVFIRKDMLRIEWADGRSLDVPTDLDRLAQVFKQLAPEDGARIDTLVRDARRCAPLEPPLEKPIELMNPLQRLRLGLRYWFIVPVVLRYKNLPITACAARFKNPALREVLKIIVGNDDMSALVLVMLLAFRTRNNTGFVAGGSWGFSGAIASRYQNLGGGLRLNTRVTAIKVDGGRAVGVECDDGTFVPAARVVSCADGYTTIFKLLAGRFVNKRIRFFYEQCQPFPGVVQVSLGVKKVFPEAPHTLNLPVRQPLRVDDRTVHERLELEVFGAASGFCPEGTTMMTVRLPARYEYWRNLKTLDPARYRAEKTRLLQEIVSTLEGRFPGLAAQIERSDIATPATYERYTGNWQGSYEGWLPTPRILGRRIPCTLPGLENFYMAGHWVVAGGGLPSSALAGRYVAQMICAAAGKTFTATTP
jgi:phytoene dehydrogenase-like protein